MSTGDGAPPLDVTLTLLAAGRGWLDPDTRISVLDRCGRAEPGASARLLVEAGCADVGQVQRLLDEASAIEQRALRILGDDPLTDGAEQSARHAVREGLLDGSGLRMGLVDVALRGGDASLATLIQQYEAPTLPGLGDSADTLASDGPTPRDRAGLAADGGRLGRYQVTGTLGAGGMGQVLSVLDGTIGREVAAKVIRGEATASALNKFVLEARVTGQLQHPSIVPAYELGRTEDGQLYLTMKKVEGQELAAAIARVKRERGLARPARSARHAAREAARAGLPDGLLSLLQAFLKVCEGVAYAHSKGVIHRDLKPANIMVGAFGEVLVMDWGLAKITGRGVDADPGQAGLLPARSGPLDDALRTLDGAVMGTPAYMPPEQAEGKIDQLDRRADVYALGAILYEILALEPPYQGRNSGDVVLKVVMGPPPSPTARVDGAWPVPWELEAVVLRAMARRRDERYPDVPSLAADIEAFLAGDLLAAARYTRRDLAWRFARRHWRALAGSAVVLVSVLGALAYGVVTARAKARAVGRALDRERDQRVQAEDARQQATVERRKADASLAKAQQMGAVETLATLRGEAERDLWWTPLERVGRQLTGELEQPPTRARLAAAIRAIDDWDGRADALIARRARFVAARDVLDASSLDPWVALQRRVYQQLVLGCATLAQVRGEVRQRRAAYAARLQRATDAGAWAAAAARIVGHPRYRDGLRPGTPGGLVPQVDLVPLGPDPTSGLEEFAHLGSGALPRRGGDGRLQLTETTGIVFVLVPGGRYRIGAPQASEPQASANEGPAHEVELDAFLIGKTEVTQAQWVALGGTNESRFRAGLVISGQAVTGQHPVEMVSWFDCVRVLGRRGLVLPTEVQWEAAVRGRTAQAWWTGRDPRTLAAAENVADVRYQRGIKGAPLGEAWDDGHMMTAPVGSYRPRPAHPFGLHDAAGNVREWCRDLFDEQAYRRPGGVDGQGRRREAVVEAERRRVNRGGCWNYRAINARSASRSAYAPSSRVVTIGCRAARSVQLRRR